MTTQHGHEAASEISAAVEESARTLRSLTAPPVAGAIAAGLDAMVGALAAGHTVYCCGNGGSAADADHFVAELVGRCVEDRAPLPSVALTVSSATVTAIANDYGYTEVFARQLRGLARRGDVLVVLTTSGRSANVTRAVEEAAAMGVVSIALTGAHGLAGADADVEVRISSSVTARIQEAHKIICHVWATCIERALLRGDFST